MWCRQKNYFADINLRRRLERAGGVLLSTQITAQYQAAHTMRDHIDLIHWLTVSETKICQQSAERVSEVFDRRSPGHTADIEEDACLPVGLEHLIGGSEGAGK